MGRAAYRVRQFFRALTAPLAEMDTQGVEGALTPAQQALFRRMSPADRQHGLEVYRTLAGRGDVPADLLAAALLHDVGKAALAPSIWLRVMVVLLERFAPRLLERLSEGEPKGWRRPFAVYRQHAGIGAEWAAEAGCSPLTVALIRHHHGPGDGLDKEGRALLRLLQEADGTR